MKKILSLLLVSILTLSMTACASKPSSTGTATDTTTQTDTAADEDVAEDTQVVEDDTDTGAADVVEESPATEVSGNLTVWMDNDDWADAVIEEFTAKYPDVTIEYENVGNVDARGKVSLDGPAGIGPDVFLQPHDGMALAISDGLCQEVPDDLQAKYEMTVLPAALETCMSGGQLYGVPISTENIALFYNKDLVDFVPTTFEEIIEFAKEYNNPAEGKWAIKWSVDDSYHNYHFLTAFGMELFGPNHDDYKNPGWDSEAALKGVQFHKSLREIYDVNTSDADWNNTVAMFQNGEVPFTITGPWAINDALKNGVNLGITKLPTIEGKQPRCFSGNIIAQVSSYSENKDAAFAFVDFLGSEEGASVMYKLTGKLAALNDISNIEGMRDDEYLKGIQMQSPYADPMPIIPEMAQAWDAQKALFTYPWNGELTPEEAQAKAMETFEVALQAAGKSLK